MNYRPNLERITVPLDCLLLDPNNPRVLSDAEKRIALQHYADPGVQDEARSRMENADYRVDELVNSITSNGWQPVDMIFVQELVDKPDLYVTLEGNRRVTALRKLKNTRPASLSKAELAALESVEVMEVKAASTPEETKAQISYLLGVRHHGSLRPWRAFAQAHNIYERYLAIAGQTDETFKWNDNVGKEIANTLSVEPRIVAERLRVYRVLQQLEQVPEIAAVGIKGKYYSLCREVLHRPKQSPLRKYIPQDPHSFLLTKEGVERMDALCHFSTSNRDGAPISAPVEWRSLEKILKIEQEDRREESLERVIEGNEKPSLVYAEYLETVTVPVWSQWLSQVTALLSRLHIGDVDEEDSDALEVSRGLAEVLTKLNEITSRKHKRSGG